MQNNIPDVSHDPCCSIFIFISKCAHWFQHRSLYACLNIAIWSFYLSQPFLFLAQDKRLVIPFLCVCVCVQFGSWRDQFLLFDFCRMDTGSFERKTIFSIVPLFCMISIEKCWTCFTFPNSKLGLFYFFKKRKRSCRSLATFRMGEKKLKIDIDWDDRLDEQQNPPDSFVFQSMGTQRN